MESYYFIVLTLLIVFVSTYAQFSCIKACWKCKDETLEPSVVELYCDICSGCKRKLSERNYERKRGISDDSDFLENVRNDMGKNRERKKEASESRENKPGKPGKPEKTDPSATCPPQPVCESVEDEDEKEPKPPFCPPIKSCKKQKKEVSRAYLVECPPCEDKSKEGGKGGKKSCTCQEGHATTPTCTCQEGHAATPSDHLAVYIGLPKNSFLY